MMIWKVLRYSARALADVNGGDHCGSLSSSVESVLRVSWGQALCRLPTSSDVELDAQPR